MAKSTQTEVSKLKDLRKRLSAGKLTKQDLSTIDQMIVGHIELNKSIASAKGKIGNKVVLAKLPFGVDLVK